MALRRVFTYLGAVFLMSHIIMCSNAGAVDSVYTLNGYSIINSAGGVRINCDFSDETNTITSTQTNVWTCGAKNTSGHVVKLRRIYSVDQWNFQNGDIIEYDILVWSAVNLSSLDGFVMGFVGEPSSNLQLIGFKQVANNVFYNNNIGDGDTLFEGNSYYSLYRYTFKSRANFALNLGFPNGYQDWFIWHGENVNFRLLNISQYRLTGEGSPDQQNEINATNDSVQQSETEGESSQSDAQTGTASLISTIGSAVSAITSASPTNCLLNGNMGNFDMGQIDLCSNPVPAFVQIISSLILILITVPLCIVMFNRFIGLFRSFQG